MTVSKRDNLPKNTVLLLSDILLKVIPPKVEPTPNEIIRNPANLLISLLLPY
jgi:hypothetical protein